MTAIVEEGARRSYGTILATTDETTIYTAPPGVQAAYLTWLIVSDDAGEARTITLRWTDDSESETYTLAFQMSIAANEHLRMELDLVIDPADTLLATASAAGVHVAVTVKELARRKA